MFEVPAVDVANAQPALFTPAAPAGYSPVAAGQPPQYAPSGYTSQPPPRLALDFGFDQPMGGGVVGPPIHRPKKSRLGLILGLVFGGVALIAGVVVAFVMLGRNAGGAAAKVAFEDLLAHAPENAQFLAGVDVNQVRNTNPNWRQELTKIERESGVKIPPELAEQLSLIVVGIAVDPKNLNRDPTFAVTFNFNRPYDRDALKKLLEVKDSVQVEGKEIFPTRDSCVAFYSETKIIAGSGDPKKFHAMVFGGKPRAMPPAVVAEVNRVKHNGMWLVGDVSPLLKNMPRVGDLGMVPVVGLPQMLEAVKNSQAVSFTFDMPRAGDNLNVAFSVVCANEGDANQLSQSLNANWNNFKPMIAGFGAAGIPGMPGGGGFAPAINDLTTTLAIGSDGARAGAQFSLSQAGIKGMQEAQNAMNAFMPPGGLAPPRVQPPPINPNPVFPKGPQKKAGKS
jgi:hypothetical protein